MIDAYAASVDASVKLAQAISRLRSRRPLERRWGLHEAPRGGRGPLAARRLRRRKKADDPGKEKGVRRRAPGDTPVKAAPVSRITLFEIVSAPGKVTAMTQAKVRAPFAGTLTELRVTDGDPVSAGQIIGSIVARDSGSRALRRAGDGATGLTDSERGDAARARALAEKNIVRAPPKVASDGVVESHAASAGDRVSEGRRDRRGCGGPLPRGDRRRAPA